MATNIAVTPETLITVKVTVEGSNRKFKIPLRDLGITTFPDKLRCLLSLPSDQVVLFERFSDSAGTFVALDSSDPQVYKQLYRAAKAKLKLRIRATVFDKEQAASSTPQSAPYQESLSESLARNDLAIASAVSPAHQASGGQGVPSVGDILPASTLVGGGHSSRWSLPSAVDSSKSTVTGPSNCIDMAFARSPGARDRFFAQLANVSRERELALRMKEQSVPGPPGSWSVYCNNCDHPMANAHFHCSICDDGDYDLCESCVEAGYTCPAEGHWLIKRFVTNGKVIHSTTERVASKLKPEAKPDCANEMPGAFDFEPKAETPQTPAFTRTCNCCIKEFPEAFFVTCTSCEDYDLCIPCLKINKHGHHPGHVFEPVAEEATKGTLATKFCSPGRNVRHAATCDGCDKPIYGVRNKCLNCPDFDYCSECFKSAALIHGGHRFAPIYEPLSIPLTNHSKHFGVYCDGPLCRNKDHQSYITGVRYKCAICHDTDFCANCEAIQSNRHNRTHPLIMFKTPVDNVNVSTTNVDKFGKTRAMGDRGPTLQERPARKSASTETVPAAPSVNAATQVQTVADLRPTVEDASNDSPADKPKNETEIKQEVETKDDAQLIAPVKTPGPELKATFVRDMVADGTKYPTNMRFVQTWTLRNPGPDSWPAGCSVRFIGGDSMLNVDYANPTSFTDLADATESNVIGRTVGPGEQVDFRVVMKTPKRAGKSISYWRLKTCDGTPFGHKLWCDIDVVESPVNLAGLLQSQPVTPSVVRPMDTAQPPICRPMEPPGQFQTPLRDYQKQMMLLEQQNKNRLMMARAHRQYVMDKMASASSSSTPGMTVRPNLSGSEHQTQLQLLEQHKKIRQQHEKIQQQLLARHQTDKPANANSATAKTLGVAGATVEPTIREVMLLNCKAQIEKQTSLARATQVLAEQEAAEKSKLTAITIDVLEKTIEAAEYHKEEVVNEKCEVVEAAPTKTDVKDEDKSEGDAHGSHMIFPTLEKESPTSSTYESARAPSVASPETPLAVTAKSVVSGAEPEETFEDVESLDLQESEDADDGFSTDGEWDVLDASDEEFAASASVAAQK